MIKKELLTVELNDVSFDVYFQVETCKDGEKVFELQAIEPPYNVINLMPLLDSRVVENIERLAIAKYVKNESEARDDD